MPQFDTSTFASQLFWLFITFTLLYLIMARVALPKIGGAIERRQEEISDDLDAAERFKEQTEKAIADYEQALADARAKAHAIAKENSDRIASEMAAEAEKMDAAIAEKVEAAEARIAEARAGAMAQVETIAKERAGEIVAALIGSKPAPAKVTQAVAGAMKE